MSAYHSALETPANNQFAPAKGCALRTFHRLTKEYFDSSSFFRLSEGSQRHYRYIIERWLEEENIGHRLVAEMSRAHVDRMLAKRAAKPGLANNVLQKIRILIRFAIDRGWRHDDPTTRSKGFPLGTIHTWTDQEIAAYAAWWPLGTAQRTAFALLLYTGQRVSDVSRMVWGDMEGGRIRIVQQKTRTKLTIPVHPDLESALRTWPRQHVSILTSRLGKPFAPNVLSSWMAYSIDAARLPKRCVPHGLRKAAARLLAEAGCSVKEIQAITGHASLSEVERYTKAADQGRLADAAFARLTKHKRNSDSQT